MMCRTKVNPHVKQLKCEWAGEGPKVDLAIKLSSEIKL